jgi:hypothetical protein
MTATALAATILCAIFILISVIEFLGALIPNASLADMQARSYGGTNFRVGT